jgi:cyclophilin family peptidyl-prolyl cis-trans isomerase
MKNLYKFIIPLFALAFLLVSCNSQPATNPPTGANSSLPTASIPPESKSKLDNARKMFDGTLLTGKHTVVLKTTKGDVTIELDADAAPKTVTNFILLAKAGFFDGLTFHRVIPGFMIQGGDPNGDGTGGESVFGATFDDEINAESYGLQNQMLKDQANEDELPPEFANLTIKEFYEKQGYTYNDSLNSLPMTKGAIAMANRGPNTNGSQFFIVEAPEVPWLNGRHTVFGNVTEGMDIVTDIANVSRDATDKPDTAVTMTVEVK